MAEITGSVQKDSIPFFFQLYVNKDRKASEALLRDAEKNGIKGVWFTIDGPVQGKRGTPYFINQSPSFLPKSHGY
jgi:L-lactate dehydrogenase (cytochrome)